MGVWMCRLKEQKGAIAPRQTPRLVYSVVTSNDGACEYWAVAPSLDRMASGEVNPLDGGLAHSNT